MISNVYSRTKVLLFKNESYKLIWTAAMVFLIVLIHHMLRLAKDTLIISQLGTEAISAIKVWGVFPATFFCVLIYIKLTDFLTRSKLFHLIIWFFVSYFVFFVLVAYPLKDHLILHVNDSLYEKGKMLSYLIKIICYWPYSLFYIFSELWCAFALSISFWQMANHINNVQESKRFYPLFNMVANLGPMIAGLLSHFFAVNSQQNLQLTLNKIVVVILASAAMISFSLVKLKKCVGEEHFNSGTKIKREVSIITHLKYITTSRPMILILFMMLGYFISLNLLDGVFKKMIENHCGGDANHILSYMSKVEIGISLASILLSFLSFYLIQALTWLSYSLLTPLTLALLGSMFFLLIIFKNHLINLNLHENSILIIALYIGSSSYVLAKSMKHSIFDTMKETFYIPLSQDLKVKGKAAVEALSSRWGKGGGAFIQHFLLVFFPSANLISIAPLIFVLFLLVLGGWIYSTNSLNRLLPNIDSNRIK